MTEPEPIQIFDLCYRMDMGCGYDVWRYQGYAPGHPTIVTGIVRPSPPASFDEETLILKTVSGRVYKVMSFDGNQQEIIEQIKSDIAGGGFKLC